MHIPNLEQILITTDSPVRPEDLMGRRLGDISIGDLVTAAAQDTQVSSEDMAPIHITEEPPDGDDTQQYI